MKRWKRWACFAIVGILGLGPVAFAAAPSSEPILRMELGTHNAGIYSMALDAANRILVTGSEDKTVRVWDITDGAKLLRVLRPPVGDREQGQIFAVALAPDGRTIACGGRTGVPWQGDGCVYLFDRNSGQMTHRLGGLNGFVQHLAFTGDSRFLAVVTGESGGKSSWSGLSLFGLPEYRLVAQDREYGNFVRWVASSPSGMLLATSCLDGFVRLYDLSRVNTGPSSRVPITPVSKIRPPGGERPWGLAFSPDEGQLAVGFNQDLAVDVLTVQGNALAPGFTLEVAEGRGKKAFDLKAVAWSADGRMLYAGGSYRAKKVFQIRKWDEGGRGVPRNLPLGAELSIHCLLPLPAGGVVYASNDGSFGMIDAQDRDTLLSPKAIPIYAGSEDGLLLASDGATVQFAYEKRGGSPALFNVNQRQLVDTSSNLGAGLKAGFTLVGPITEGLDITDWKFSLAPKLNGRPLPLKQEMAQCLTIQPDHAGFLIGTNNELWRFTATGTVQWHIRAPAIVWSVNTNGQVAVAALGDGTIRWYRLTDGEEVLAFFPHPDRRRWILWTPSGYYDASQGGEDFIGWQVNNGPDQAADFFPISRLRSAYFRPDVIDQVLVSLDEAQAVRLANEDSGRKATAAISVRDKLPPVVTVVSPADGAQVAATSVTIGYALRSLEPITAMKVLVDGRPVTELGTGQPIAASGSIGVTIPPQDCTVSVIAENRSAASVPATIRLRWTGTATGEQFTIKPKLYVLTVGVSAYEDADLRLDLAAKDAMDFGAAWHAQQGHLYSGVEVRTLTDAQATKGNILDGLDWLQRQTTSKDVAVLFFAGHGVNDSSGDFYFLPVEADLEKLKRTGISQFDITATVAAIAGKVLVFMDACHSGNLMGKSKRRGMTVVSPVVNELASAENGAVVFSSATGRQFALENEAWGNGAFTKGVVEGLQGKADYGATGRITLNMLDLYISERVKELTQGQQTPTTVKPPNVPDFPVAVLR